jgi:predicted nucleic acid-binding protein
VIYVDTSALVALIVKEPGSAAVADWYAAVRGELVSATWCVTEFGSALGLKQRTSQIDAEQAQTAWARFERLVAGDVRLLPVAAVDFHRAAMLTRDAARAIRAGDALHLACAERHGAKYLATRDAVMAKNARWAGLDPVAALLG